MNRFIIAGAPCAGKSTFVRERFNPHDLIWDYDAVHMALSGLGSHNHLEEIRPYVLAAREAVFNQLAAHASRGAWVITSSPKKETIEALAARFAADIIFLEVTPEEAHSRAESDDRPPAWHDFINNWFENSDINPGDWSEKTMKRKTFKGSIQFKAESDGVPGAFKAVFATLNVIDLDGDVTIPGAFQEQPVVIEPWNHAYSLPAGKGVIKANDSEAWIEGKFILDSEVGRENYATVKELGDLVEWSYTFDVLDSEIGDFQGERVNFLKGLDVVGVSPVTRGAGIETRTVEIKGKKAALAAHETATSESAWDGPENESRVRSGEDLAYYRLIYAWRDPAGDPTVKSTYKFIHHEISGNGDPGAANVRACQTGIGVLNGARGGTTIPEADLEGVYNHLARHLRDAEVEAPELKEDPVEAGNGKTREYYSLLIKLFSAFTKRG